MKSLELWTLLKLLKYVPKTSNKKSDYNVGISWNFVPLTVDRHSRLAYVAWLTFVNVFYKAFRQEV